MYVYIYINECNGMYMTIQREERGERREEGGGVSFLL
jgi:hypothetical protein